MKNYELLKPFYSTKFKEVFLYDELSSSYEKKVKELEKLLFKQENIDISGTQWLYSTHEEYYIIGIQNDNVVGITSEGDFEVITDDFALIPFSLISYKFSGEEIGDFQKDCQEYEHINNYRENLRNYSKWCKNHGIFIPENELKWID